jgi:hypothetical protein
MAYIGPSPFADPDVQARAIKWVGKMKELRSTRPKTQVMPMSMIDRVPSEGGKRRAKEATKKGKIRVVYEDVEIDGVTYTHKKVVPVDGVKEGLVKKINKKVKPPSFAIGR